MFVVAIAACTTRVTIKSPTTSTSKTTATTANVQLARLRCDAAKLLEAQLAVERRWADGKFPEQDEPPMAWGTAGAMRQQSGLFGFVDNEAPLGGETVSIVVSGSPDDHPDDVLYMGARVGTTEECFYVRDVIGRASASMTVATVYAAGECVRPDLATGWQLVKSPLVLVA